MFRVPTRMVLVCGTLLAVAPDAGAAPAGDAETGRDFPKTLIFDEPGIDDEISLPTLIAIPRAAPPGRQTDVDFELDKRLTTWLSVQINTGYTSLSGTAGRAQGWQDTDATLKLVLLADRPGERLVSLSLTREFGGSGARQIGAARASASVAAVNFGQGWSPLAGATLLRPVAVTGSLGFLLPDRAAGQTMRQAVLSASLQYSFDVLIDGAAAGRLPTALRPLIPILECVATTPAGAPSTVTLAPGLIYAGAGFQLAAEALLPLTRPAGTRAGFIAQLNISLATFGWPVLTHVF